MVFPPPFFCFTLPSSRRHNTGSFRILESSVGIFRVSHGNGPVDQMRQLGEGQIDKQRKNTHQMNKINGVGGGCHFGQPRHLRQHSGCPNGKYQPEQEPIFKRADLIGFGHSGLDHHGTADDQGHTADIGQPFHRIQLGIGSMDLEHIEHDKKDSRDDSQSDK